MPYLNYDKKEFLNNHKEIDNLVNKIYNNNDSGGMLCFVVYKLMVDLARKQGDILRFGYLSKILSEVDCAKLEFYRRIVAPYEDKKIIENGDV